MVGARPQFIKAAIVSRALQEAGIQEVLVHTGQHYDVDMSELFFDELDVRRPDHNLGVGSCGHGAQTGRMLEGVENVLLETKPELVLVYGDTNSTLAGALAAAKLHMPVAHVEAGLRSFNRQMPEEINRVLTDHCSDVLFAPTATAEENLRREGIPESRIHLVGDVMYDAALHYGAKAERSSRILRKLRLDSKGYILATVHRAANTDEPDRLRAIFDGLCRVAREFPVVMPLHPRTRSALLREGLYEEVSQSITILKPVGYLDMLALEKNARLVATDSGGMQKESFFFGVPCVALRDETEWVELVALGWVRLVKVTSADAVVSAVRDALAASLGREGTPYGEGRSATAIAKVVAVRRPAG